MFLLNHFCEMHIDLLSKYQTLQRQLQMDPDKKMWCYVSMHRQAFAYMLCLRLSTVRVCSNNTESKLLNILSAVTC